MTTPARWQHVITDAGHHLRLTGANGETVLTSEVYTDPRQVGAALAVTRRAASLWSVNSPDLVDERTTTRDGTGAFTRSDAELYTASIHDGHYPDDDPEDLTRLLLTPAEAGLTPPDPGLLMCPECATGKHPNCTGQALHPVTDALGPCGCAHDTERIVGDEGEVRTVVIPGPLPSQGSVPLYPPRVDRGPGHEAE